MERKKPHAHRWLLVVALFSFSSLTLLFSGHVEKAPLLPSQEQFLVLPPTLRPVLPRLPPWERSFDALRRRKQPFIPFSVSNATLARLLAVSTAPITSLAFESATLRNPGRSDDDDDDDDADDTDDEATTAISPLLFGGFIEQ